MQTKIYATVPAGYNPATHKPQTARVLVPTNAGEYYTNDRGQTLFNCTTDNGAHIVATRAQMREIEPIFVFESGESSPDLKTPAALAHRAIYDYHQDPARVLSALAILATPNAITPQGSYYVIQSDPTRPRYTVTPKSCPCHDSSASGNVCKHRIAAWMYQEQHAPLKVIYQRVYCVLCNCDHWLKDGWTCEGADVNPLTLAGYKAIKTATSSRARVAEIVLEPIT